MSMRLECMSGRETGCQSGHKAIVPRESIMVTSYKTFNPQSGSYQNISRVLQSCETMNPSSQNAAENREQFLTNNRLLLEGSQPGCLPGRLHCNYICVDTHQTLCAIVCAVCRNPCSTMQWTLRCYAGQYLYMQQLLVLYVYIVCAVCRDACIYNVVESTLECSIVSIATPYRVLGTPGAVGVGVCSLSQYSCSQVGGPSAHSPEATLQGRCLY